MARSIFDAVTPTLGWLRKLFKRPTACGRVTPYYYYPGQERRLLREGKNEILYGWGASLANLLANTQDGKFYHVGGMYFEFDNSGSPVNPTPTISRANTRSYYADLSGTQDYLRVPITLRSVTSEDEGTFPDGNMVEFYAETSGSVGMNGLPFSSGAGSRVYGVGLVVMRDPEDETEDIVFSQYYFAAAQQLPKLANDSQIGSRWRVAFQ